MRDDAWTLRRGYGANRRRSLGLKKPQRFDIMTFDWSTVLPWRNLGVKINCVKIMEAKEAIGPFRTVCVSTAVTRVKLQKKLLLRGNFQIAQEFWTIWGDYGACCATFLIGQAT